MTAGHVWYCHSMSRDVLRSPVCREIQSRVELHVWWYSRNAPQVQCMCVVKPSIPGILNVQDTQNVRQFQAQEPLDGHSLTGCVVKTLNTRDFPQ